MYLILTLFCSFINLNADPVIILTMLPYPLLHESPEAQKAADKLKMPGHRHKLSLRSLGTTPVTKGIFSTYAGWLGMSDADGETAYLRKQVEPIIYLLITDKITPLMTAGNTIQNWAIEEKTDAKMYKMEQIHDMHNDLVYWVTEEVPLPQDRKIPIGYGKDHASITVLAQPKNIFVPEGITLSEDSPNLVLPPIYIKKGIKINTNALYILNLRQFFGSLHPMYKKGPARNMTLISE